MARTTKKANTMMTEEKLAQALVPDVEQPYRVPENWCWTKLGSISFHISDGSHNPPKDSGKGIPLLSATNIHDRTIDFEQTARWITNEEWMLENERTRIEVGDILLTIVATIGRVAVVTTEQPFALQRSVATIKPKINAQYLSYYFESPYVQTFMNTNAKGTAQKGFYLNSLKNLYCAIPPLTEQQHIVDRIESLFAKLDEAKEKAQAIVDSFADRRAVILHKAFAGELTRLWAKQHGISVDAWQTKNFDDVAEVKSNLVNPAGYPNFPHIAPDNIEKKTGKLLDYHTVAEDAVKSGKHRFYAGQILYSKIRPNLSKVVVIDFDGLCSADMYPIKPRDGVNAKFLWYYMLSDDFVLQASTAGSRSVLPKINQKELASLKIQVTDFKEQEQVVTVLDKLFEKEQQAKEAAEQVIDQIDTMKKSILARAFRGELGTNDPNDESAVELLKRVLCDDVPAPQRAKPITIPKELASSLQNELEKKIVKLYFQKETKVLPAKEIMGVSSKTFDILDCLRSLQNRQIIIKQEDGNYKLMG